MRNGMRSVFIDQHGNQVPEATAYDASGKMRPGYGVRVAAVLMDGAPAGRYGGALTKGYAADAHALGIGGRFAGMNTPPAAPSVRELNAHRHGWATAMRAIRNQEIAARSTRGR